MMIVTSGPTILRICLLYTSILVFHDRYDIPAKGSDGERQWESEEVFEYMICAICPLAGEYEPGKPVCGFLFPAFVDRSGDPSRIDVFQACLLYTSCSTARSPGPENGRLPRNALESRSIPSAI